MQVARWVAFSLVRLGADLKCSDDVDRRSNSDVVDVINDQNQALYCKRLIQ